jgi:hypothetical protein
MLADVAVGSWSCKNALAEALTTGDAGAVAGCSDFPEFSGFFVLEALLIEIPAVLLGSATADERMPLGGYILIAAMSGWTPMMFMTRVRL